MPAYGHAFFVLLVAALVLAAGCSRDQRESKKEVVLVLCAASTATVLRDIAEDFEAENLGVEIKVSSASSSSLARQIDSGIDADLFLSANQNWTDLVESKQLVTERVDLLSNEMVLVVPRDNPAKITSVSSLVAKEKIRLALANEHVPAGIYAEEALQSMGLYQQLLRGVVRGSNVRVALAYVERGEADAAVVYRTDALSSEKVVPVETLPPDGHSKIVYPLAKLRGDSGGAFPEAASRFFDYLQAPCAAQRFRDSGFIVLASPN